MGGWSKPGLTKYFGTPRLCCFSLCCWSRVASIGAEWRRFDCPSFNPNFNAGSDVYNDFALRLPTGVPPVTYRHAPWSPHLISYGSPKVSLHTLSTCPPVHLSPYMIIILCAVDEKYHMYPLSESPQINKYLRRHLKFSVSEIWAISKQYTKKKIPPM